ncbi:MAG: acylphosphatase [Microbacterium sp.]
MRRVRVVVEGRVQGVGYRFATATTAARENVCGWVRNRRDGSVEAELEGEDDAVDAVCAWMADGPPSARVTAAHVEELAPVGAESFDIRPDV